DRDGLDAADSYTTTIDWGDNHASTGTVSGPNIIGRLLANASNVYGTHTYFAAGSYSITVNIADSAGHTATGHSTAVVRAKFYDKLEPGVNAAADVAQPTGNQPHISSLQAPALSTPDDTSCTTPELVQTDSNLQESG